MMRYYRIHIVSNELFRNFLTYFNVSYVVAYTLHYFTKLRHIKYLLRIILKSSYHSIKNNLYSDRTTTSTTTQPPPKPRWHCGINHHLLLIIYYRIHDHGYKIHPLKQLPFINSTHLAPLNKSHIEYASPLLNICRPRISVWRDGVASASGRGESQFLVGLPPPPYAILTEKGRRS
jgi:hypothetical protein